MLRNIIIFLFAIVFISANLTASSNAESAIVTRDGYELYADTVSFNDEMDLIVKTREVVGECDTTWADSIMTSAYNLVTKQQTYKITEGGIFEITCRRLVGVTVIEPIGEKWEVEMLDSGDAKFVRDPGRAIIFYEPCKLVREIGDIGIRWPEVVTGKREYFLLTYVMYFETMPDIEIPHYWEVRR